LRYAGCQVGRYHAAVATWQPEREVLERSVHAIADRAKDAYGLIEEIHAAGFPPN
jgi:uncharacterized protein (DUF2461 family)